MTTSRVASDSEYGCDMYANALENVSQNKKSRKENIFRVLGM